MRALSRYTAAIVCMVSWPGSSSSDVDKMCGREAQFTVVYDS
jgi:hypothetical protein